MKPIEPVETKCTHPDGRHCFHNTTVTPPPYGDYWRTDVCCHCGLSKPVFVHRPTGGQVWTHNPTKHGPYDPMRNVHPYYSSGTL